MSTVESSCAPPSKTSATDPDFEEYTRLLLADIAAARGQPVPPAKEAADGTPEPVVYNYPFNLILTSATIPNHLSRYLDTHHPALIRLASPHVHKLPAKVRVEHAEWTGGNRAADVESRIRDIWHKDMADTGRRSKVLVFCNKSTRVEEFGKYLAENGVPNVALTSTAEARSRGSNRHLEGFLRERLHTDVDAPLVDGADGAQAEQVPQVELEFEEEEEQEEEQKRQPEQEEEQEQEQESQPPPETELQPETETEPSELPSENKKAHKKGSKDEPHVLITTSLLSRGLDFAPDVRHVLVTDPPRNMIDFLHRAGRTGRAGSWGTVVVFGKTEGRGSSRDKEVMSKVRSLKFNAKRRS